MNIKSILTVAGIAAFSTAAQAAVVNIDLNQNTSGDYSGQGAYASPGDIWNTFNANAGDISETNLLDSNGVGTTIALEVTRTGAHARSGYTNNLLRDGAVGVSSITFSGLTAGGLYDLTMYSTFADFDATFAVGAISGTVDGSPDSSPYQENFVDGETFTTLSNVQADGSGSITVAVTGDGSDGQSLTFVTGMQIATVPEPSSAALLGLGGISLILLRRK